MTRVVHISHGLTMTGSEFFCAWTRDFRIGAVTKSSRQTIAYILSGLPEDCDRVVEYGPGDGVVTRHLLARMPPNGKLLTIEQNVSFLPALNSIGDPRLTVRVGDIRVDAVVLRDLAGGPVGAVVSTAPLGLFSRSDRDALIAATRRALRPGGRAIVCQYTPRVLRAMHRNFTHMRTRFALANIPPYFVHIGTA